MVSFTHHLFRGKIFKNHDILLFAIAFMGVIFLFWPGVLRSDSLSQLAQATSNTYSDHNPPMMAFLWHALNLIYAGPGLMFTLHVGLFFGASFLFCHSLNSQGIRWFYLIVNFTPFVLSYMYFVLKDISFTSSFLMVAACLHLHTTQKSKPSWPLILAYITLLFYGTAVKYQAIFILPVIVIWLTCCINSYINYKKIILQGVLLTTIIVAGVSSLNTWLAPNKEHSWQYVKFYDLAGISLRENQDLIPQLSKSPFYSFEKMKERFNEERVDEMIFVPDSLFVKGRNDQERAQLWQHWWKTVATHPSAYLKHRLAVSSNLLKKSPIKSMDQISSHHHLIPPTLLNLVCFLEKIGIVHLVKIITSFYLFFPLSLCYLAIGFVYFKQSTHAKSLVWLNLAGTTLVAALFVFSMASDPRYIYLSVCFLHYSHPLAWLVLRSRPHKIVNA